TSKSKPDIEAKPDVESEIKIGVEIEAKGEKQETNEAKNPEEISDKNLQTLLIHHLEHCFLCIPWLSLLTVQGEKKPKILIDLEIFVKESLHKLFQMVQNKTIKFCVFRFLECSNNKENLKTLHQSLLKLKDDDNNKDTQDDLQKLLTLLEKYKEFVHLKELYVTVSVHYKFDENTNELQQFSRFCENWDLESFPDAQEKYLKELETLQKTKHQLEELREVTGSWVFKKLWTACQIELKGEMMLPFQETVNTLHKNTFSSWNKLKQTMTKETFQIKDIEWFKSCELSSELVHMFPLMSRTEIQSLTQSIETKLKKIKKFKSMQTPWSKLIEATEVVKKNYKLNSKIAEDSDWIDFVNEFNKGKSFLTKTEASVQQLSTCYDNCAGNFKEVDSECVELLDLIAKHEETLIKELTTSTHFVNKNHFENTIETLNNSKDPSLQTLVGALRTVNENIRECIWNVSFERVTDLANALLKLHKTDQMFVHKFRKCCDADLNSVSYLVEEAGQLQAVQSLEVLTQAAQIGKWVFASCNQVLQHNDSVASNKERKNTWFVLKLILKNTIMIK
ncbi:hypothetical protein RFI_08229, partial [Reticulomyxa filosa]